jgi:hypothetical protein
VRSKGRKTLLARLPILHGKTGQNITKTKQMNMNHSAHEFCAVNNIVGLSLDRLPSGKVMACEVRKDEAGELRVPIAQMSLEELYRLASRLHLEILPSRFASRQEMDSHRAHVRRLSERAEQARELRGEREAEGWKQAE